jgi:hypothetical protein
MGFIGDYTEITTVDQSADLVPIVQGGALKTATPNSINGYASYSAMLNQSGTGAPVATCSLNTTGAGVTYSRTSAGVYVMTFDAAILLSAKTQVIFSQMNSDYSSSGGVFCERTSDTEITIYTPRYTPPSVSNVDDLLYQTYIEVRILN